VLHVPQLLRSVPDGVLSSRDGLRGRRLQRRLRPPHVRRQNQLRHRVHLLRVLQFEFRVDRILLQTVMWGR